MIEQPARPFRQTELLYEDGIVVVMSSKNPLGKRRVDAGQAYAAAKHVYIRWTGNHPTHTGRVDRILETQRSGAAAMS